ncbi:MAG: biosynthetic arginine decarboxylase [Bacteroidota bacterium]|nr:biosynthetic arginine decarboxylase [Bacteroidota bacterium]MDP4233257.1 biosynthetic arginine decarboxylase [Bacteroidota bacterium]MDP4242123.1 biosynthetic arginine decarboxylase [Bacteroidota bacterium]MDP4289078.1 biosynthetic arginine decarboxylase [Bacteroidota bacterium]
MSEQLLSHEQQLTETREYAAATNGLDSSRNFTAADFKTAAEWTIEDAVETYNIDRWGLGYFGINEKGHVTVAPLREQGATMDVMDVISDARDWGLRFPLVLRFQDLLRDRVVGLNRAFADNIKEQNYQGQYLGVFPIKVNQLREVVEEIEDAGRPYNYGLEAGSKPELFAALATHTNPDAIIICNGYKDTAFIRTALMGNRLGKKVIMIAEKVEEVKAIIEVARELGVKPLIGVRIRLAAKSTGIWSTSGGESAKFGLSTMDLVEAIDYLTKMNALDSLELVHFHIGSQVPDILSIKRAIREATRYYAKLLKMGLSGIRYLDVGGGLGIDYDGSRSSFHSSTNYTMEEYAADTVYNIMDVCDEEGVPHPQIVSESGRAIVAHHALLVVQVFGAIEKTKAEYDLTVSQSDHKWIKQLRDIEQRIEINPREALHDTLQIKDESQNAFDLGILDLPTKAKIETFYWHIVEEIAALFKRRAEDPNTEEDVPEEIADLTPHLADQYLCNFSVFQSLLDHWALGQIFPIMPIHRLDQPPTIHGTLVDITCDSDGKVTKFADIRDVRTTLPLHPLKVGEEYFVGFFLTGAYQDIMGDLHNLFGRVNEAHVFLDPDEDSGFYIEETIPGNSISQVLELTQYHEKELVRRMKVQIDEAIKSDRLKPNDAMRLLNEYEKGLQDHTYLTFNGKG